MQKINIAKIANSAQCHSLLSGHYDWNVLIFSIVKNVNNFTTYLGLPSEDALQMYIPVIIGHNVGQKHAELKKLHI